jgi:hypothetical protein
VSQQDLLRKVVSALNKAEIDFMLTGSFASSLQGEPRSTHDIDLVVDMKSSHINVLTKEFPAPDYYLSKTEIADALRTGSMFNLLDVNEGEKVDFWMLTEKAFDQSRFQRRQRNSIDDFHVFVTSPEDTILAKLNWSKLSGGSEKQFGDALHVFEVQFGSLDMEYLEKWVKELGVKSDWQRLLNEADTIEND